jgi:transposase
MKIPLRSYTVELKEFAVKRVKDGQSYSAVANELSINEQMELSRLRAENARLKRESEIIKK